MADLDGSIGLAMTPEPAIVLAPPEMLDIELGARVVNHVRKNPGTGYSGLTDAGILTLLVEQDSIELHTRADLSFPVVDADDIPFADTILSRSILKHCVHRRLPGLHCLQLSTL
jgi:hypothetical protein